MRAAPAVGLHCSGGFAWRLVQALVPALAAAAVVAWLLGLGERPVVMALGVVPLVGAIAWGLARPLSQALNWDGQCWRLAGREGSIEVMIDLGGWLLLRFDAAAPGARSHLVAVSGSDAGPALHGLRAAVYCRPPEPTPGIRTAPHGPPAARPD